jgi:hypothetical protein
MSLILAAIFAYLAIYDVAYVLLGIIAYAVTYLVLIGILFRP